MTNKKEVLQATTEGGGSYKKEVKRHGSESNLCVVMIPINSASPVIVKFPSDSICEETEIERNCVILVALWLHARLLLSPAYFYWPLPPLH